MLFTVTQGDGFYKEGGIGVYRKPQNREKIIQNHKTAYKTVKNGYHGEKWSIQNTNFIKVFVKGMDLSEAFVSFGMCLNHRLYFCRSLTPGPCRLIFPAKLKAAGNGAELISEVNSDTSPLLSCNFAVANFGNFSRKSRIKYFHLITIGMFNLI